MNRALWIKAVSDAWRQLAVSLVLLTLFSWLFVWLMSRFPVGGIGMILKFLPDFVQPLLGVPAEKLATPVGQLSILYVHVVTLLICIGWALGRGTDSITGEISRGTMDMILTLPVWRSSVVLIPAVVTAIGAVLLPAAIMLGTRLGLAYVRFDRSVDVLDFLPGAVNLGCMIFCFAGITTMVSAGIRDRWVALAIAGGFYIVELVVELVSRMWPDGKWLHYLTFLYAFDPQSLILVADKNANTALCSDLVLLGVGMACYVVALLIFNRRDIPGPR